MRFVLRCFSVVAPAVTQSSLFFLQSRHCCHISKLAFHLSFRIEAGHPELRDVRQQVGSGGGGQAYPDVEDDDADPNYALIQSFRDRNMPSMPQSPPYSTIQHAHARTPSPQGPSAFPGHANNPTATPDDDPLDRLYAKVNKPRGAGTISPPVPAPPNDR